LESAAQASASERDSQPFAKAVTMARLHLLASLATTLLVALPAQAQEGVAFHCTFKAVFETIEGDSPSKSSHEKQFVGHRMDVLITEKPTATVIADVFTLTMKPSDYVVSQRGSTKNDWVLSRTDQGTSSTTITLMHIRTWSEPVRFTFAWGSTLAVGTCEKAS
jgi:hypothetical protein